jgi:hypothetical protein
MVTVPPLTCIGRNGHPYKRRIEVEEEIVRALAFPPAQWEEMAKRGLSSEALVFLIRSIRNTDRDVAGRLIKELNHRILRTAKRWCRGFDRLTTESILLAVEQKVIDLLLASVPTASSEYLEAVFDRKVKQYTLNEIDRISEHTVVPASSLRIGADEEDPEQLHERIEDDAPNPEQLLIEVQESIRRAQNLPKALAAIRDPRHRKAVLLHHVRGWPLSSQDPSTPSLARLFNKSPRQIHNWIKAALKDMRGILEEES